MISKTKKAINVVLILLLGGIFLNPNQVLAADKDKLVVALSSDVGTLDPQYHNVRNQLHHRVASLR